MRNDSFWDMCTKGSLRSALAEFMDNNPILQKYKGEAYYALEDAIMNFIEENKLMISHEVDMECWRDDLKKEAISYFGDEVVPVLEVLPVERIDSLIETWQENLMEDDDYLRIHWEQLDYILDEDPEFSHLCDYESEQLCVYIAYLKQWYSPDNGIDVEIDSPVCIDEFYNCEMSDEELTEYYELLAKNYRIADGKLITFKCPKCDSENIVLSNGGAEDFYYCVDCCEDSSIEEVEEYSAIKNKQKSK